MNIFTRVVNCSRLINTFMCFLAITLLILARPVDCMAQDTQDPALLEVQPFSENTRRARRARSIPNAVDVARSARFIYVLSQSLLVTSEDYNDPRSHTKQHQQEANDDK